MLLQRANVIGYIEYTKDSLLAIQDHPEHLIPCVQI